MANKSAWMTTDIMTKWLGKLNRRIKIQKRNVHLFLDNTTCHPDFECSNVRLIFLSPNMTSVCEPLDSRVIRNFKRQYIRKQIRQHMISNIDSVHNVSEIAKQVPVLDTVLWIISSGSAIKPEVV